MIDAPWQYSGSPQMAKVEFQSAAHSSAITRPSTVPRLVSPSRFLTFRRPKTFSSPHAPTATEGEECNPEVAALGDRALLIAGIRAVMQPGEGAFDDPAVTSEASSQSVPHGLSITKRQEPSA